MKHIAKGVVHHRELERAHQIPPQSHKEATNRWGNLKAKDTLLTHLKREQLGLCCYSEYDCNSIGFHIEHVENKKQTPNRTFDFANLAASAFDSPTGLKKIPSDKVFGGHALGKSKSVDMARFISPHSADCASYFTYLQDGRIVPNPAKVAIDRARADYTIAMLNLNSSLLVSKRREYWKDLEQWFDEHMESEHSLNDLAEVCLVPTNDCLSSFFSVTKQFFGALATKVLTKAGYGRLV